MEIPEPEFYDFDADKSKEKFQVGQIWAVYSDEDMLYQSTIVRLGRLTAFQRVLFT